MAKSVHKILLQIEYHNAEFFAPLSKNRQFNNSTCVRQNASLIKSF
jgi:hypothetical protein